MRKRKTRTRICSTRLTREGKTIPAWRIPGPPIMLVVAIDLVMSAALLL